jgi:RHS repeat-associated protein
VLHGKNLPPFTGAVFVNSLQVLDSLQENPLTYGESVSASMNLRYPGQYFDRESGLNYNYFRSYDSRTGRYSQSDPIGLDGGWNKFAYVDGDPLGLVDPYGLQSIPRQGGYNPNDVRGGFDSNGESLVYNPKYYDPSAASAILLFGAAAIGGPCACAVSAELSAIGMYARLSTAELTAITRGTQTRLLSELFKNGAAVRPKGLTNEAIAAYKELAKRIVCEYEKTGNLAGISIQEARLKLLSLLQ